MLCQCLDLQELVYDAQSLGRTRTQVPRVDQAQTPTKSRIWDVCNSNEDNVKAMAVSRMTHAILYFGQTDASFGSGHKHD